MRTIRVVTHWLIMKIQFFVHVSFEYQNMFHFHWALFLTFQWSYSHYNYCGVVIMDGCRRLRMAKLQKYGSWVGWCLLLCWVWWGNEVPFVGDTDTAQEKYPDDLLFEYMSCLKHVFLCSLCGWICYRGIVCILMCFPIRSQQLIVHLLICWAHGGCGCYIYIWIWI